MNFKKYKNNLLNLNLSFYFFFFIFFYSYFLLNISGTKHSLKVQANSDDESNTPFYSKTT